MAILTITMKKKQLQQNSATKISPQKTSQKNQFYKEYLNCILHPSKISGNKKETSDIAPNNQLVSSKISKTDNISLRNLRANLLTKQKKKEI